MSEGSRPLGQAFRQPPFVVCAAVLAAATVFAGPVARHMRVVLRKDPVPLRKPLGDMDKTAFGEYRFDRARTLDEAIVNTLDVSEYIDWRFVDTTVPRRRDPLRRVSCFITYSTGKPNLVPHIPDQCYLGAGYKTLEAANRSIEIEGPDTSPVEVPIRAVTFVKSEVFERATPTVVYTFHCNGTFLNRRTEVRAHLGNPFDRGAYFCKVEVTFGGPNCAPQSPTREQSIDAAQKFLSRLLPVLLAEHLPDWEAVQEARPSPEG